MHAGLDCGSLARPLEPRLWCQTRARSAKGDSNTSSVKGRLLRNAAPLTLTCGHSSMLSMPVNPWALTLEVHIFTPRQRQWHGRVVRGSGLLVLGKVRGLGFTEGSYVLTSADAAIAAECTSPSD